MVQPSLFDDEPINSHPAWGIDQATMALLPFADRRVDRTQPVTIQYQAMVAGRPQRISVTMRPGAHLELPSQTDQVIFLGLLQVSHEQGNLERVTFRRAHLFRQMRWSDAGARYEQFEKALERLAGVTMKFETELISRSGTPYRRHLDISHLIDRVEVDETNDWVTVEWGGLVRQAIELGDFKRLDWQLALNLDNPIAVALYRFLDRAVLHGETNYEIGWKTLAKAIGMSVNYPRPAQFLKRVEPHIERLVDSGVITAWDYQRGGKFRFQLTNYLRSQIRRILGEYGVFPAVSRDLTAGYDELHLIRHLDHLQFRKPATPGGYVTEAIRNNYELRYPEDEPEAFEALWNLLTSEEQRAHQRFAERFAGAVANGRPAVWPQDIRTLIRFAMTHSIDPERC